MQEYGKHFTSKAITYTVAGVIVAVTVEAFAAGRKKSMTLHENGKVMAGYCCLC